MWYFPQALRTVRRLDWQARMALSDQVGDAAQREPLHLSASLFTLPALPDKTHTGRQVVALMLALIWVAIGENPDYAAGLLGDWPDLPLYALLA